MERPWVTIVATISSGLSLFAIGGWISTRDAARDAYAIAVDNRSRIHAVEEQLRSELMESKEVQAAIPNMRDDINDLRAKQNWVAGVLYDLARAVNPRLPISPPPDGGN